MDYSKPTDTSTLRKTVLKTDFIDYYDHWFDKLVIPEPHHTFKRMSRTQTSRRVFLEYMEDLDIVQNVIPHGLPEELGEKFGLNTEVVVYTDPYAHTGYGKEKMTAKEADKRFQLNHASLFMESVWPSSTIRRVQIGTKAAYMIYSSNHPWKSNVGDVQIKVMSKPIEFADVEPNPNFPMFAIDYIFQDTLDQSKWYAIDFNPAPLLKFTPVEEVMSPQEVVQEIREWMVWAYDN